MKWNPNAAPPVMYVGIPNIFLMKQMHMVHMFSASYSHLINSHNRLSDKSITLSLSFEIN